MNINQIIVGAISTNCYIIETGAQGAVVIDPGDSAQRIKAFLDKKNLTVKLILLTHGHFDHIGAAAALDAPVYIHESDAPMLTSDILNLLCDFSDEGEIAPIRMDKALKDGDVIVVDDLTFTVMHTPGHTMGSVVYLLNDYMFSGDTLFCGNCGRTDFVGSDPELMKLSLLRLAALDADYTVLSGHGESTTLSEERRSNPYLGKNYDDIF